MARRFIINNGDLKIFENTVEISGSEAHHINVLRKNVKDKILVNEYVVEITKIESEKIYGVILGVADEVGVPNKNITLIQSYLKSDKMEYVCQKAVELGVKEFIPVITKNTVVKLDDKTSVKKVERLNKISLEAIGQCGRTDSVKIGNVTNISNIDFSEFDLVIVCHEKATNSIDDCLENIHSSLNIAVIIGPEGGLEESDIAAIKNCSVEVITFGKRILRAETASLYILSILDYLCNN